MCAIGFIANPLIAATIGVMNYNDPTPAYFGSGNPAGSWTSATTLGSDKTTGDNTVALRFKDRSTGDMTNDGAGTYSQPFGVNVNVEFSASATNFQNIVYQLSIDSNPGLGTTLLTFDPKFAFFDNSLTPFSTNGVIMQNSQRDIWYGFHGVGTYDMSFSAFLKSDKTYSNPIARTEARLKIGGGTSRVPDSGTTMALLGTSCFGVLALGRKFRK